MGRLQRKIERDLECNENYAINIINNIRRLENAKETEETSKFSCYSTISNN